jgi:hypothetical protein
LIDFIDSVNFYPCVANTDWQKSGRLYHWKNSNENTSAFLLTVETVEPVNKSGFKDSEKPNENTSAFLLTVETVEPVNKSGFKDSHRRQNVGENTSAFLPIEESVVYYVIAEVRWFCRFLYEILGKFCIFKSVLQISFDLTVKY